MKTVIVTGSYGLIGSEVCRFYDKLGFRIIGIDNDMRKYFFGEFVLYVGFRYAPDKRPNIPE